MDRKTLISICLALLAGVLWGLTGLFIRILSGLGLATMEIVIARTIAASAALWLGLALYNRRLLRIHWQDCWIFLLSGSLSVTLYCYCYYRTMELTSLAVSAILIYTAPVIITLCSVVMFKEALTRQKMSACLLAFVGCALVAGVGNSSGRVPALAIVLGLSAAAFYSVYSLLSRVALNRHYHPLTVTAYSILFGFIAATQFVSLPQMAAKITALPIIGLYCILSGILTLCLPLVLFTISMTHLETGRAAITSSIEPVIAAIISVAVFHEPMGISRCCGILVVLAAIVLLNIKPRRIKFNVNHSTKTEL